MIHVTAPSGARLPVALSRGETNDAGRLGRDIARLAAESADGAVDVQQLAEAGWTPDQLHRLVLHASAFAARRLNTRSPEPALGLDPRAARRLSHRES